MAFSPQNDMLASGGVGNLIIWSLKNPGVILKHLQRSSPSQEGAAEMNGAISG